MKKKKFLQVPREERISFYDGSSALDEHMYETSRQSQVSRGRKIGYHTHRHTDTDGTTKRLKQVKVTGPARGGGKRVMAVAAVVAMVAVAAAARSYSRRRGGIGGDLNDLLSILYVCVHNESDTRCEAGWSARGRVCVCVCV